MVAKIKTNELTAGKWFKNLRLEEGLTLANLSDMSGFYISTIWRIENNKIFPNMATVISLLRIMFGDDDKRFEKERATYYTLRQRYLNNKNLKENK